ncbi:hypothetical protein [Candidatus Spongiisocius sp.]|uniref:hypothetical protein n=1 Tax=Candidatus Spongiisocius sp. TaxID=3101273 RepID=UPI003B5B8DB0
MSTLRIGILGTGRIGALHAELLRHEVDGIHPEAVYDISPVAGEVGARLGIPVAAPPTTYSTTHPSMRWRSVPAPTPTLTS